MKYTVLKDFTDQVHKVTKVAGEVFVPAETNYPADKVARLVETDVIELIKPRLPNAPPPQPQGNPPGTGNFKQSLQPFADIPPRGPMETDAQFNARVAAAQRGPVRIPGETDAQFDARVAAAAATTSTTFTGETDAERAVRLGTAIGQPVRQPTETDEQFAARVAAFEHSKPPIT